MSYSVQGRDTLTTKNYPALNVRSAGNEILSNTAGTWYLSLITIIITHL